MKSLLVTEIALLRIRRGNEAAFEDAFASVEGLVAAASGYIRHRLVRTLEDTETYLLEVEWEDLTSHVDDFEPSEAHARFIAHLQPFLAAEPSVIHVPTAPAPNR